MARRRYSAKDSSRLRQRIAREAARLIARKKVRNFHTARMRAMRWLSQEKLSSAEVPTQEEVMRELDRLTGTIDWNQHAGLQGLIDEVAGWLEPGHPLMFFDGQAGGESEAILCHWLVDSLSEEELMSTLSESAQNVESFPPPAWAEKAIQFSNGVWHAVYQADLKEDEEVAGEAIREVNGEAVTFRQQTPRMMSEAEEAHDESSWSERFRPLLESLAGFQWNGAEHPEGDALYHSLQVYQRGCAMHPYDLEFLWSCLLHDIGYVVDPRMPREGALRVLEGRVTPRVEFLVGNLEEGHRFLDGETQAKSLRKSPDFELLLDLVRCDRNGRQPGEDVPGLEEVFEELEALEEEWG